MFLIKNKICIQVYILDTISFFAIRFNKNDTTQIIHYKLNLKTLITRVDVKLSLSHSVLVFGLELHLVVTNAFAHGFLFLPISW